MNVLLGVVATCGLTLMGSRYASPDLYGMRWMMQPLSPFKRRHQTLLDILDTDDVVRLVQIIAHDNASGDDLAERLFRLYKHFPPNEKEMRVLCTLYEASRGKGTAYECACTLLYGVATDVLCHTEAARIHTSSPVVTRRPRRSQSF
jgi:hypothetical protein